MLDDNLEVSNVFYCRLPLYCLLLKWKYVNSTKLIWWTVISLLNFLKNFCFSDMMFIYFNVLWSFVLLLRPFHFALASALPYDVRVICHPMWIACTFTNQIYHTKIKFAVQKHRRRSNFNYNQSDKIMRGAMFDLTFCCLSAI